ncbi:glycine--tRNA ligase subunit beta [Desulfobaculum bizertense]|uniref:Glycine--tRNA ligase beta subunit n=1 Tax=Desulfobaculum bizertense DSM 18034 TaxID=1121442 RepID=A0A1T4W2Z9_9BACT|nr:glycine--tRNA ligase subunit beta [Desulfobaculum bizertense]UIJ38802.1 glycine--tRNA ligase subunit beta [Desulfobaculum bizertense]SKA71632.1 glycyl-tRNA synthetase beta chain [Desulfobaculum bizertense DSM 18034]
MSQCVLEIGTEEIPARFFPRLNNELGKAISTALSAAKVEVEDFTTFATPRRIAFVATGVAAEQRREEELFTGPPKRIAYDAEGQPTKAALGFAKTQGVDINDCFILENDKGEYLAVRKMTGGASTASLLPEIFEKAVASLQFPKKMRWGTREFGFGRPIHWFVALFDDQVIPFSLAGIESGRSTLGHRVLGKGEVEIAHAADYLKVIREDCAVVLDAAERKEAIRKEGDRLAAEQGGKVVWNDDLLDEVCGLVEHPVVILGEFDRSFLEVPREVLLSSMEGHQKSFGVEAEDGSLLPFFVPVLNIEPKDMAVVKKGWERVLRARLEDARFFWKTDLEANVDEWLTKLDDVIFFGPLGSMGNKTRRIEKLCGWLSEQVDPSLSADLTRAGRMSKADLESGMVGEFDELQGIMGGIYAEKRGESAVVSKALYEQYLPAGPNSPVPSSLGGALLSMADKADTLAGCFGLNKVPTGANDPFALRRAALGICRIVLEHNLRIDLDAFLREAQAAYGQDVQWKLDQDEAFGKMQQFFANRLRAYFQGKGYETLAVDAALGAGFADLWALAARVDSLSAFCKEADFEQAVLTFKRASNIIVKQGKTVELSGEYSAELLEDEHEKALAARLTEIAPKWEELWKNDDFASLFALLRELRPDVDAFFDNVMVMCEDEKLRLNRLNMLKALVSRLGLLADFAALQV